MPKLVLSIALSLLAAAPLARAGVPQDGGAPDASVPLVQATVDKEQAEKRIAELLAAPNADEPERARLVELYRQLVQRLEAEQSYVERGDEFRQAIDAAPIETARLREELAALEQPAAPDPGDLAGTSEELQQRLTQLQADLSARQDRKVENGRRIAEEEARAALSPGAEAREALAQVEAQLSTAAPLGADATEFERLERTLLLTRQRTRRAEIAMLQQEELSRPVRLELLRTRRDLAARNAVLVEGRLARVETRLADRRQEDAERARRDAERLRRAALDKHVLIQEVTARIAEITGETEALLPEIATVREERKSIEGRLAKTSADLVQTNQSLRLGITGALGTVLLEQRRSLPNARSFRRAAAERGKKVGDERLRLFFLERELKGLEAEGAVDGLLTAEAVEGLSAQDRVDLRTELVGLLARKRDALILQQGALKDYLDAVRDLETQERELIATAEELGAILDEELIWIPDALPLGAATFTRLHADIAWLLSPELWMESVEVLGSDFGRLYGTWPLVILLVLALLVARRRLGTPLEAIAARVGKVRRDGIHLTLEALALQALRTLPVPAAAVWVGWRLMAAKESTEGAKAVGAGLVAGFTLLFIVQLLRNLFRATGIARAHFRWSERTGLVVRRNLLWFLFAALPSTFLIGLTQAQSDHLIRDGIGRLAFIALTLATAVLAYRLLHGTRGLVVGRTTERASLWLRRSRRLWLPIGMLVPLALAVMAATGYYYAALMLEYRINQTLLIILATTFLHAFLLRWLMVSQRRLALRMAVERRAALAKKTEAGGEEEAGTTEGVIDTLEEIDIVEIQDQTHDLLRISLGLLFVVALWFAWVDILPALRVLDDVHLWYHEVVVDGVSVQQPITLANLGLALLSILVTIAAARNMPGFLEIALLQRLPLEPGVRYATRSLVLYTIVSVGILLSFQAIGVGWSSVQWLVAALTVGLGFGLQEIFANFVSGLIILLERPIRVGDTVTIGEVTGVVSRIRMRATTITDWSRRELLVPNKSFITGELINWSLSDPILRMELPVGIAYGSDTTRAHRTILETCRAHPLVLAMPEPSVYFLGFGDNSLNFEARVFVNELSHSSRSRIMHDLHMAIDRACRENDITIAFPQRDLHFKTSEAVLRVSIDPPGARP